MPYDYSMTVWVECDGCGKLEEQTSITEDVDTCIDELGWKNNAGMVYCKECKDKQK